MIVRSPLPFTQNTMPTKFVTTKISIVEDNRPARELRVRLLEAIPGVQCDGAYPNAEATLREVPRQPPDLLLMDLGLPGLSGVECVRRLKELLPDLRIIMVTKYEDPRSIHDALTAGADGYLLKRRLTNELARAIQEACEGMTPISPEVARYAVKLIRSLGTNTPPMVRLSPRESEVLGLLADGHAYKQIAETLGTSYSMVNHHLKQIYKKLGVHSRHEAVLKYRGTPKAAG